MRYLIPILATLALSSLTRAELIFHEPFDFPAGISVLGNENGWQKDWDDAGPSEVNLYPRNTQENSPFEQSGLAIQPSNSRDLSFKILPEPLNGKTVYFSFSMKLFRDDGQAVFRFRTIDGYPVQIGMMNGEFAAVAHRNDTSTGKKMKKKVSYFIAGRITASADGKMITLSGTAYDGSQAIPAEPPAEFEVNSSFRAGRPAPMQWSGIQFMIASSAGAFDDLRIATTWAEVTNPNAATATTQRVNSAPTSTAPPAAEASSSGQPPLPFAPAPSSDVILPQGDFAGTVGDIPEGWRSAHPDYIEGIGASIELVDGNSTVFTNTNSGHTVSLRSEVAIDPAWIGRTMNISAMLYARNLAVGPGQRDDARVALAYEKPDGSRVSIDGLEMKRSSSGWETLQINWTVPPDAVLLYVEPGLFQATGALAINKLEIKLQ